MAHHNRGVEKREPERYECPRCGAESEDPGAVRARYCAICGCHGAELAGLPAPAAVRADEPVTGVHRLPVA